MGILMSSPEYRRGSYNVDRAYDGIKYATLFPDVETAAGQLGYHVPRHGRPAVAYDGDEDTAQERKYQNDRDNHQSRRKFSQR